MKNEPNHSGGGYKADADGSNRTLVDPATKPPVGKSLAAAELAQTAEPAKETAEPRARHPKPHKE